MVIRISNYDTLFLFLTRQQTTSRLHAYTDRLEPMCTHHTYEYMRFVLSYIHPQSFPLISVCHSRNIVSSLRSNKHEHDWLSAALSWNHFLVECNVCIVHSCNIPWIFFLLLLFQCYTFLLFISNAASNSTKREWKRQTREGQTDRQKERKTLHKE